MAGTAVVTGAAGHLGANLVRELLARGMRVRALLHSDSRAVDGFDIERAHADVRDEAALREAFAGGDVVYHLAVRIAVAAGDEDELEDVNVGGTCAVVAACMRVGVARLVHFSSVHALVGEGTVDEHSPLADGPEVLPYDRTKALAEREVLGGVAAGLDAVIVNPTGVIGPYDFKPSHMGEAMLSMYHRTVPGLVDGGFDWVDARDVARTAVAAAERGRRGERYLLGGHWATLAEVSALIAAATGVRTIRFASPMPVARAIAPVAALHARVTGRRPLYTSESLRILRGHRHVRSDKAMRELGHAARPLRETIADTFAWFGEAGVLDRE